jgi:hypothetical protein
MAMSFQMRDGQFHPPGSGYHALAEVASSEHATAHAGLMREQLTSGELAARRTYLSSLVDAIIVSEEKIRIVGSSDNIRSTSGPRASPRSRFADLLGNGAQGRNRTTDTAIFSRMLYQLSYLGVLQERGQSPSSGRFIVGSERPVHPASPRGFAGRGPAVHKPGRAGRGCRAVQRTPKQDIDII